MSQEIGNPAPFKDGKAPFTPSGRSNLPCETAYWMAGDLESDSVPLICIHGGPGAPGRYLRPMSKLYEKLHVPVILYDQVGSGSSTRLPSTKGDVDCWTYDVFVDQLDALISYLGIKTFDLFGHSWGGAIASLYALRQPTGLRKLIICSTASNTAKRLAATQEQYEQLPGNVADIIAEGNRNGTQNSPEYQAAMQAWSKKHFIRVTPYPQDFIDTVTLMEQDDTVASTMSNQSANDPGIINDFDIVPDLPRITGKTVPGGMLVMYGQFDMTPEELIRPFWTEVGAKVRWERFEESSHMMMLEETQKFLSVVGEFLKNDF